MNKVAEDLQDSVVDLTRQLTELQARYESTRNHLLTRTQHLDRRESELRAREEQLSLLEKSIEERESSLDQLHDSLEEQRKHNAAVHELLRVRLTRFEDKAQEMGFNLRGNEIPVTELESKSDGLDADEVAKLIGSISDKRQTMELCRGLDFAHNIPDIIRNLIERKQLIEAVRFICTFKFADKFPPIPLLSEYLEDAKNCWTKTFSKENSHVTKVNAVDDRISKLRAVAQCVNDHNLESEYSVEDIINYILELENLEENPDLGLSLDTTGVGEPKEKRGVVLCLPSIVDRQGKRQWKQSPSPNFCPRCDTYHREGKKYCKT